MLGGDTAAGILLILAAFAVILIANSPLAHDYHALLHDPLAWTPVAKLKNLHLWINDALMAIFFFVVGLEIKREVLDGQLSSAEKRRLRSIWPSPEPRFPSSMAGRSRRRPTSLSRWACSACWASAFPHRCGCFC